MQTNFSAADLANPRVAEADRILKRCVHCGLCTAVCSTYVVLGDERDSPRGRIYLIKDMFERGGEREPSDQVRQHVDRCLSCLSCTSTCPSGVDYMHLVDAARAEIEERRERPLKERVLRQVLAAVIPHPRRFRLAIKLAPLARPMIPLLERLGLKEVAAMLALAPLPTKVGEGRFGGPGEAVTHGERRARVLLSTGCVQPVLRPEINDATIRLLARRGVDVVVAPGAGCCGAVVHHMGREEDGLDFARRNIDAWSKEIWRGQIDAIIINASGCGTTVKDYGYMLRNDPEYAEKAKKVSELAKDISEFLHAYQLGAPERWSSLRVAYHSACSLQHGQRVQDEPKELLKQAGFAVVDVPEGHICCGSAGTYNILQPDIAGQLRKRKLDNIRSTRADVVAAGNIGCITHLDRGDDVAFVHTVELLDWAYGGPVPRGLEHLKDFVSDVPRPRRQVEEFIET